MDGVVNFIATVVKPHGYLVNDYFNNTLERARKECKC